jgi:hypothetical protein
VDIIKIRNFWRVDNPGYSQGEVSFFAPFPEKIDIETKVANHTHHDATSIRLPPARNPCTYTFVEIEAAPWRPGGDFRQRATNAIKLSHPSY